MKKSVDEAIKKNYSYKMEKFICFRFDVDTHVCIKKGVPELITLFKKYDANCTFFVNMGRSFNYYIFFIKKINAFFSKKPKTSFFSITKKLGFINTFKALLFNPKVGATNKKILHEIIKNGHELGLHGGKNHATWEKNAKNWSENTLANEIEYGLNQFKKLNLPKPTSFASPCWNSPNSLIDNLKSNGFLILADHYSLNSLPCNDVLGVKQFPTNILAKDGNIGFIENFRALGYNSTEILKEFENQLDLEGNFKMVFDHPIYAGIHEIHLLSQMIEMSISKGYKIESLKNISKVSPE